MLRDVDDKTLYLLFRPELRSVKRKQKPVQWEGYSLNLTGTKFTIARGAKKRVIWDTFRFYQSRFTAACRTWGVNDDDLDAMEAMKAKRGAFDVESEQAVLDYCLSECRAMARLTYKLVTAHKAANLPLRSFYGAGSTASVLLKRMGINKVKRDGPEEAAPDFASAFFGGRFENRVSGPCPGRTWSYDISSAYPYQLFQLPCLECGTWERTTDRRALDGASAACVRYTLDPTDPDEAWGPLPFRCENGSIVFPRRARGGGWVWRSEFLAAERHFEGVGFREAWVYRTDCTHRPFQEIAAAYVERLKLGKEGAGIVLKLGCNSCYGKLAQSVGVSRPFRSIVWAGMTTAGTRSMLLDSIGMHRNRSDLLMVATDGIYTRQRLSFPAPVDTGTMTAHKKPLGGWEEKEVPRGVFAARPGIYFPLEAGDDDVAAFRARGIGRKELFDNFKAIMSAWERGAHEIELGELVRFHGAKSSISVRQVDDGFEFHRSERYGQWRTRPIRMSFNPLPKRGAILADGTLTLRDMPDDVVSLPYKRALLSPEARAGKLDDLIESEQPQ